MSGARTLPDGRATVRTSRREADGVGFGRMEAFFELCVRSWRRQLGEAMTEAMSNEDRATREEQAG